MSAYRSLPRAPTFLDQAPATPWRHWWRRVRCVLRRVARAWRNMGRDAEIEAYQSANQREIVRMIGRDGSTVEAYAMPIYDAVMAARKGKR